MDSEEGKRYRVYVMLPVDPAETKTAQKCQSAVNLEYQTGLS